MTFQPDSGSIRWRVHLRSSPAKVYDALATDEGRALYWAERTVESDGVVTFHFSGHPPVSGPVLLDARRTISRWNTSVRASSSPWTRTDPAARTFRFTRPASPRPSTARSWRGGFRS